MFNTGFVFNVYLGVNPENLAYTNLEKCSSEDCLKIEVKIV